MTLLIIDVDQTHPTPALILLLDQALLEGKRTIMVQE
jgi:hypothetical protein